MEQRYVTFARNGAIGVISSFFLYKITSTTAFFIIPLLLVAPRLELKQALLLPLVVLLLIIGDNFIRGRGIVWDQAYYGTLAVGLYLPLSMLVGVVVYLLLPDKPLLVKFLAGSAFAALGGICLVLWFRSSSEAARQTGEALRSLYAQVAEALLGSTLGIGVSGEQLFDLIVMVLELMFLPLFMVQYGFSLLLSEFMLHRKDPRFQHRMVHWKLPVNSVWVFLGSWSVVLLLRFVDQPFIAMLAWNCALGISLLYLAQGVSLAAYLARKRNQRISAMRIFILLGLLLVMPGINTVFLIALPLLGISETWVSFRVEE